MGEGQLGEALALSEKYAKSGIITECPIQSVASFIPMQECKEECTTAIRYDANNKSQ